MESGGPCGSGVTEVGSERLRRWRGDAETVEAEEGKEELRRRMEASGLNHDERKEKLTGRYGMEEDRATRSGR
jgi:hypothetical protein